MAEWLKKPLIPIPERYQVTTFDELVKKPELLDSLIQCYQNVFGGGDIWGEGAACSKCGKVIDIDEYVARVNKGDLNCGCEGGGKFKQLYTREIILNRLITQASTLCTESPFLSLMSDTGLESIVGFSWGSKVNHNELARRILLSRYSRNSNPGYIECQKIVTKMKSKGVSCTMYCDEVGVMKSQRSGMEPVFILCRYALENADRAGANSVSLWTEEKSPMFIITQLAGFEVIEKADDGTCFLLLDDIGPLLTLFQRCTSEEASVLASESFSLI